MVNIILKYLEQPLKAYMPYLNVVDSPVIKLSNGKIYKGSGSEKQEVCISDSVGNALYVRQTQPETFRELKAISSSHKQYQVNARCRALFYTFGTNDFKVSEDKVKSGLQAALNKVNFNQYTGTSTDIVITINSASFDAEKLFKDETGVDFSGNEWPIIVAVDFTLSYNDVNCNSCDIEDIENPFIWIPDVEPQNCENKAVCDVVAACPVIITLQSETASLQEQINNLPAGFGCDNLPECQTIIDILQEIDDLGTTLSNYITSNNDAVATIIQSIADLQTLLQDNIDTVNTALLSYINSNDSEISNINSAIVTINQTLQDLDSAIQAVVGDLWLKEDVINKVTDFTVLDNVTYPTTQATKDLVDYYVQSNIKIIGDWDASSGSYPLADESNTTPFIAQWGPTMKVGWAFRVGYGQEGTVDGYDYENGDVVYALVDSPADTSADWGDLDHNLQQATESLRGTAKIASDIDAQSGADDEKIVTSLKLENWRVAKKLQSSQIISIVSSATPTVNVDSYDITYVNITAQGVGITSMSSGLSGTPANFARLIYRIKDDGTARSITWGASFTGTLLPLTTVVNQTAHIGAYWDSTVSKYRCVAYETQA